MSPATTSPGGGDLGGPPAAMQLRIKHTVRLDYRLGAEASVHEARLTPLNTAEQQLLRSRLEIRPMPWTFEYTDYWGNHVTSFEVYEPHEELTAVATSLVQTRVADSHGVGLTWGELSEFADELCEFLAQSPLTDPGDDLASAAAKVAGASDTPAEAVEAVCDLVRSGLRLSAEPHADVAAAAMWNARLANRIDLAQVAVGGLRCAGIPTRFVAGHLHPADQPVVGETIVTAPHAWLEYFDGEWVGYDPLTCTAQGAGHVAVARGRDHRDLLSLRGIYSASQRDDPQLADLTTNVEITRVQ